MRRATFAFLLTTGTVPFTACGGSSRNVSDRDGNHAGLAGAESVAAGTAGAIGGAGGARGGRGGSGGSSGARSGGSTGDAGRPGSSGAPGASGESGGGAMSGAAGGIAVAGEAGAGGERGGCEASGTLTEVERTAGSAQSSGFAGTDQQYTALEALECEGPADCVPPCLAAGGTREMCEAGVCMLTTPGRCLPMVIWMNTDSVTEEGSFAQLLLYSSGYQDELLASDFGFALPESARVEGITVSVRRNGSDDDVAVDHGVRLLRNGVRAGSDLSSRTPWARNPLTATYGGPGERWGETWTAADVNSSGFGVALGATFALQPGGAAYVDWVKVRIAYRPCD